MALPRRIAPGVLLACISSTITAAAVACNNPAATTPTSTAKPAFSTVSGVIRQSERESDDSTSTTSACLQSASVYVSLFNEPASLIAAGASTVMLDQLRVDLDALGSTIPPELRTDYETLAAAYRPAITRLAETRDATADVQSIVAPLDAEPVRTARANLQTHFATCFDALAPR